RERQGPAPPTPAPIAAPVLAAPARDEWSPQEIIKKIEALPGVAGSLIVTSDGLMVTGNAPPPLKAETMAAFLPQLFGRVGQYAGEIQLQPLSALTLMAGETRCAIFKTGKLYLAVVGRPGQTLPDALLQCLAEELAKRNP
ncbi:MAG TPA: roadblock/LC7 domain-containing protein, partial [Candidatus Saccharimonadales bacterium]|nr:roadblock/LC7 domain-containing protein [Candidatus Saccharimonadales bacterium]